MESERIELWQIYSLVVNDSNNQEITEHLSVHLFVQY